MSTQEIQQGPGMLGNIAAVEGPLYKEDTTLLRLRRERGTITVRVTFEAHRLAATNRATAYDQVVPVQRRSAPLRTAATRRRADQQPAERAGA